MAMTWIKFDTSTPEKPEVWSIATDLKIDPDAVVGKLLRIWTWFDDQSEDGNAPTVTKALLDRKVCVTGFCDAVIRAGWMLESKGVITLPNFDRHNGQTAKTRAQTAKRVAQCKKGNAAGNAKVTKGALPKEDKSKEDNTYSLSRHANSEKFGKAWDAWKNKQAVSSGVMMDSMTEQAQLYSLEQFDTDEAIAIVQFSVSRTNCKNLILNGDHKQKPKSQTDSSKPNSKRAELLEALGVTE